MIDGLGFGCVALTTLATPRQAYRLLETAYDLGVRHFDTAPLYGQGYSERLLGRFLKGRREHVSVATKFGMSPARPPNLPLSVAWRSTGRAGGSGQGAPAGVRRTPPRRRRLGV